MLRTPFAVLSDPNGAVRPALKKPREFSPAQPAAPNHIVNAASHLLSAATPVAAVGTVPAPSLGCLTFHDRLGAHTLTLDHMIGEGGFGTVYHALSSRNLAQPVAIKMVGHGGDADELADIAREVAVHAQLATSGSPHLVNLHAHYTEAMRSILVLELVAGIELEDYIFAQPHGRLSEDSARPLFAQIVDAVAHCHGVGVAHLDVTPRNILIDTRAAAIKLIDYGSSAFLGPHAEALKRAALDSEPDIAEARRGFVRERGGALNFRAPERHASDDDEDDECTFFAGFAADGWSVGCVLFFMLTGRDAFDWESEGDDHRDALLDDIESSTIPFERRLAHAPPVDFSSHLRGLVSRLLQYDPSLRPSMHQVRCDPWLARGSGEVLASVVARPSGATHEKEDVVGQLSSALAASAAV